MHVVNQQPPLPPPSFLFNPLSLSLPSLFCLEHSLFCLYSFLFNKFFLSHCAPCVCIISSTHTVPAATMQQAHRYLSSLLSEGIRFECAQLPKHLQHKRTLCERLSVFGGVWREIVSAEWSLGLANPEPARDPEPPDCSCCSSSAQLSFRCSAHTSKSLQEESLSLNRSTHTSDTTTTWTHTAR